MLKFFYRLKRKHGAVLFFVVAIMSLLIAMATTAYYTARSSYKTVVSNYDYSQLYLSAISVSDMVMDAVTNDTSTPSANNYKDLRVAMVNLARNAAMNNAHPSPIVADSQNITTAKSMGADILDYVTQHPVQDGVIDGVTVTIDYIGTDRDLTTLPSGDNDVKFYYTIETIAYYRNNTITVKDTLYNTMNVEVSNGSPTPPNPVNFSRFFTATGQQMIGGQIQKGLDRAVIINTHQISDDAYFENMYTFFTPGNNNEFLGGISSNGSVFLDKFTCNIPAPSGNDRNDWFIGEDLVLMNAMSKDLNLNGNDLYIAGDLYLPIDCNITAANIYVGGNVYFTGGGSGTINGNLYVGGDGTGGIKYTIPDDKYSSDLQSAMTSAGYNMTLNKDAGTNPVTINGNLNCNGTIDNSKGSNKLNVSGTTSSLWKPENVNTTISVKEEVNGEFEKKLQDTNVADALKQQTGTTTYENYTSKSTALENELSIYLPKKDASTNWQPQLDANSGYTPVYEEVTNNGTTQQVLTGYTGPNGSKYVFDEKGNPYSKWTGEIYSDNGEKTDVIVDFTGNGSVSVDIPYSEDGYLLDIQGADSFSGNLDYSFHTPDDDKVQQVVLKSNFTDAAGNPSFSWKGSNYGNNSGSSKVTVDGGGNLALEMGNLDKDGKYISYDSSKSEKAVIYYTSQKEAVGTPDQLTALGGDYQNFKPSTILDSNSKPKSGYENKVMLISNKNGGTAVDGSRLDNTFFGIIYAPNGDYTNKAPNGGNTPIVGGLVAARYDAQLAYFVYSEPDPDDLRLIFGSLGGNGTTPPGSGPTPPPSITKVTEGPWTSEGSSYIG